MEKATHLDLILYSREQIQHENEAMGRAPGHEGTSRKRWCSLLFVHDTCTCMYVSYSSYLSIISCLVEAPYGIISIKAQNAAHELPMQPITMMRNALGKDQGGSGVPLDASKYATAVAYWQDHVAVRSSASN